MHHSISGVVKNLCTRYALSSACYSAAETLTDSRIECKADTCEFLVDANAKSYQHLVSNQSELFVSSGFAFLCY